MVCAWHPERIVSHHAMPADEQILHDIVHGMSHVQRPGDIGQWHHDDIALGTLIRAGRKRLGGQPALVDMLFNRRWFILFWDVTGHADNLPGMELCTVLHCMTR